MISTGRRARLIWPVTNRHGEQFYLSTGQRQLLMYVRSQARHGRHVFTIDRLAEIAGIDRSNVQRGLDRLAQLELIGRRSTRGALGRTIVWVPRPHSRGPRCFRANVATTYRYAGYLTPERWRAEMREGRDRAVRRLSPPRVLYGRCAAGHRVRLLAHHLARIPSTDPTVARSLEGRWSGRCRRCRSGAPVIVTVEDRVAIPAIRPGWRPAAADYQLTHDEAGRVAVTRREMEGST